MYFQILRALFAQNTISRQTPKKDLVGVLSANPYTIAAILRVFGQGLENSWDSLVGKEGLDSILERSPVEYVRNAKYRPGSISAFTGFWVDHGGVEGAMRTLEERGVHWIYEGFKGLQEGCEFVAVVEVEGVEGRGGRRDKGKRG